MDPCAIWLGTLNPPVLTRPAGEARGPRTVPLRLLQWLGRGNQVGHLLRLDQQQLLTTRFCSMNIICPWFVDTKIIAPMNRIGLFGLPLAAIEDVVGAMLRSASDPTFNGNTLVIDAESVPSALELFRPATDRPLRPQWNPRDPVLSVRSWGFGVLCRVREAGRSLYHVRRLKVADALELWLTPRTQCRARRAGSWADFPTGYPVLGCAPSGTGRDRRSGGGQAEGVSGTSSRGRCRATVPLARQLSRCSVPACRRAHRTTLASR